MRWHPMRDLPTNCTKVYIRDRRGREDIAVLWRHWSFTEPVWWSAKYGKMEPLAWYWDATRPPEAT